MAVDWVATSAAFILFNFFRCLVLYGDDLSLLWFEEFLLTPKLIWEQVIVPLCALCIYWLSGYYADPYFKSRLQELITTAASTLLVTAGVYLALLTNDQLLSRTINWGLILILFFSFFIPVYAGRLAVTSYTRRRLAKKDWSFPTLIIGNNDRAHEVARDLQSSRHSLGYHVIGLVAIPGEPPVKPQGLKVYTLDEVPSICRRHQGTQLILSPASADDRVILNLLYRLYPLDLPIRIKPDTLSYMTSSIRLQDIYAEPFIDLTIPSVSNSSRIVKRVCDVVMSSLALLVLAPVMAAIAICVKQDSRGPVFYSQKRVGRAHREFSIYKFRSMRTDAEASGPRLSKDDDPRVTCVGRVLRKYRLDEIPQFWNVLRGDMSLVGPRPEREHYIRQIVERAPYYTLVHQVRPGITSWGMVKYGYASSVDEMVKRTRFDLIYLNNMSAAVDIKILIYTIKTILQGRGK